MRLSIPILVFALFTAAFLWPVEDAINGTGLHLVVLWLMLGMLHGLRCWRATDGEPECRQAPFGLMDFGVLLIVVGHVISTVVVFQVEGDRRAALNLTFEWVGLFAAWRLFRSMLLDRILVAQMVSLVIAVAVGLSAFGIWQHHFDQRVQSEWYLNLRTELDEALSKQDGSGLMRVTEIMAELQERGFPPEALQGPARVLWENRLLSSTEPTATFSLANTLSGILAASLMLLIGQITVGRISDHRRSVLNWLAVALQIGLVGYCLMLTKSRSAWAGATVGLIILGVARSRISSLIKVIRWGLAGVFVIAVTCGLAAFVGALDKEVIFESPRSIQFRLMYWTGAIGLLKEHPMAGAGPGNFRQLYLAHRVDESSEEIRDPHNFILDAWSSAGLTGLAGVLLLAAMLGRQLMRSTDQADVSGSAPNRMSRVVVGGLILGFGLHSGWEWINGYWFSVGDGFRILLVAGVPLCALLLRSDNRVDAPAASAAAAAIMVHLLGAGGFEMPAVMLMMLVCLAISTSLTESRVVDTIANGSADCGNPDAVGERIRGSRIVPGTESQRTWLYLSTALLFLAAAVVVLTFGLIPVSMAERHLLNGENAVHRQRIPGAALASYRLAAESDPLGVTPRQRIAELESYRLSELRILFERQKPLAAESDAGIDSSVTAESQLEIAVRAVESLISADRRNCLGYRMRARCLAAGSILLKNPEMLEQAIAAQQNVTEMYPSSVQDWAELAFLSHMAKSQGWSDLAKPASLRALELDQINRQWGHRDQYLPPEQLEQLREIQSE